MPKRPSLPPCRPAAILGVLLLLGGCHCVQGPTARGVGPGPLGFGDTAEAGVVLGLRAFVPDIGIHGEVFEEDVRHAAVVFDLSVPGAITASRMVQTSALELAWPLTPSYNDQKPELLLHPDRVTFVRSPTPVGGASPHGSSVVRRGDSYVSAGGNFLYSPSFPSQLRLFPEDQTAPDSAPMLAASPDGRYVAGVFVAYGMIAPFLVEFSPDPRLRRAPAWIQLGQESLSGVTTAVSDDGLQMIRAVGSSAVPQTDFFVTLSPDGARRDISAPDDPIGQILAVPGGWLLQTPAAILHLDTAGNELARSTTSPMLSEPETTRRMLLFSGRLVWFETAMITTRKADEAFCGEGTPAVKAVRVCATWFTARFDVTGQACTTLTKAQVLALALPTIALSNL